MSTVATYSVLSWKMLRFRVAVMLWMFMLIGAAAHDGLSRFHPEYILGALALAAAYMSATTINDIADKKIDQVNLPRSSGRPLAGGLASERQLYLLNFSSAGATAVLGLAVGVRELLIVLMLVVLGYAYSLKPLLLSHRTFLTPVVLATAYVVVPYALGATMAGGGLLPGEWALVAGLFCFFVARIVLKDFRDRAGDSMFAKPTILLRFGNHVTCFVSMTAVLAGYFLVIIALRPPMPVTIMLGMFAAGIVWMLDRLRHTPEGEAEQIVIGIAAKLGNGLLLSLLGLLVLRWRSAPLGDQVVFTAFFAALYGIVCSALILKPDHVKIGYRG